MFVEGIRHADRRVEDDRLRAAAALGLLNPPLDLAEVLEIFADPGPVASAQDALKGAGFFGYRIENAALLLNALPAVLGGSRFCAS